MGSVYKQPGTGEDSPDTAGGCQVSRRGHKEGAKGNQQRGAKVRGVRHVYV